MDFSRTRGIGIVLGLSAALAANAAADPYAVRGVIFGPYGRPWSHADRTSIIEWMASSNVGMNMYVHAPKNDVYQRLQWREQYPGDVLAAFLDEAALASSKGIAWVPNLSPGVPLIPSPRLPTGVPSRDVCFACEDDLDALIDQFLPFYAAGVRTFMISFDDVQKISTHPEDALNFGVGDEAYGQMNADLLNRVLEELRKLDPGITLLTVPADYSGTVQTAYLKGLSEVIDCGVRVMWTGTAVVSHEISGADATLYRNAVWPPNGRCEQELGAQPKLLLWDNFPVNDYNGNIFSGSGDFEGFFVGEGEARTGVSPSEIGFFGVDLPTGFKLNVGPYKGRRDDLVDHIDGILANAMGEAEVAKIPLYTVAQYLRNPAAYTSEADPVCADDPDEDHDPEDDDVSRCQAESDWIAAIEHVGGPAAGPLADFVNQMRSTPFDRTESPFFEKRWKELQTAFVDGPFWTGARDALDAELGREAAAPGILRDATVFSNQRFVHQARHHLAQLEQNARVGELATELLAATRPALSITSVSGDGNDVKVSGSVARPDPLLVAALSRELVPLEVAMRATPYSVHGDRFQNDLGTIYFRENRMDEYTGWVHERLGAWLPLAARAASGPLLVTVGGNQAMVLADGSFSGSAEALGETIAVVVTDAAGGDTGLAVAVPE